MCLVTPIKTPYVAEADIYCYKVLRETKNGLMSPFRDFPIELGKIYETSPVEGQVEDNELGKGFIHAFTGPKYMYLKRAFFSMSAADKLAMYLAIIPKGAQFFVDNSCGEICATAIKVISKVVDIEEEYPFKNLCETISLKRTKSETFNNFRDSLTTLEGVIQYAEKHNLYSDLLNKYKFFEEGSYEKNLYAYRLIVAVLTEDEKNSLTEGECWYPFVRFYNGTYWKPDEDYVEIGTIVSDGTSYIVVGGGAYYGSRAGLGDFYSNDGVSASYAGVGFRSVSSREIAMFISKHFGKLVFDLMYGLSGCNYQWVDTKE